MPVNGINAAGYTRSIAEDGSKSYAKDGKIFERKFTKIDTPEGLNTRVTKTSSKPQGGAYARILDPADGFRKTEYYLKGGDVYTKSYVEKTATEATETAAKGGWWKNLGKWQKGGIIGAGIIAGGLLLGTLFGGKKPDPTQI